MPGIDLSIIIVSFNTRDYLKNCLNSIYQSAEIEHYEVLVVDNCSGDGSTDMVESTFPQVHLLKPGENLGFARANNYAAKMAQGRYLLFLNPDTVVFPDTFKKMLEFMDGKPRAGAANCLLLNEDGSVQLLANRRMPSFLVLLLESLGINRRYPNNPIYRKYIMSEWDRKDSRTVEVISGAFFMVRSRIFWDLHGFDERYFMYVEDFELSCRITAQGYEIWFNPLARIIHLGGKSSSNFKSLATSKGIAAFYLYFRNCYSPFISTLYKILMLALYILLYFCVFVVGSISDNNIYYRYHNTYQFIITNMLRMNV